MICSLSPRRTGAEKPDVVPVWEPSPHDIAGIWREWASGVLARHSVHDPQQAGRPEGERWP